MAKCWLFPTRFDFIFRVFSFVKILDDDNRFSLMLLCFSILFYFISFVFFCLLFCCTNCTMYIATASYSCNASQISLHSINIAWHDLVRVACFSFILLLFSFVFSFFCSYCSTIFIFLRCINISFVIISVWKSLFWAQFARHYFQHGYGLDLVFAFEENRKIMCIQQS